MNDDDRRLSIPGRVAFRRDGDGGEVIDVTAAGGRAVVALKGAQVLSWMPEGSREVLWLSPAARVAGPDAMRGGVPVCWPWFAVHPSDPGKPMHGFARTSPWRLVESGVADSGDVRLVLELVTAAEHAGLWPHAARVQLDIAVGARFALTLMTENIGSDEIALTEALHAYFAVADVARVAIEGLHSTDYLDKVDGFVRKRQIGSVGFGGEVDRIYVGTDAATTIIDPVLGRRIRIAKRGSSSTVVWNPGPERAARMPDVGAGHWRGFVCVETSNAGPDIIRLVPGARHVLAAEYEVAGEGASAR